MNDAERETQSSSGPPGLPRWVKVWGVIVAVLVVVAIAVLLFSGGEHGPGRHGAVGAVTPEATRLAPSAGVPG